LEVHATPLIAQLPSQWPSMHSCEQQFALVEHDMPSAPHLGGSPHVPFMHASEQQSASAWHAASVPPQPPPCPPEPGVALAQPWAPEPEVAFEPPWAPEVVLVLEPPCAVDEVAPPPAQDPVVSLPLHPARRADASSGAKAAERKKDELRSMMHCSFRRD